MKKLILLISIIFILPVKAQYNGNEFSIGVNAIYTTSARLYLYPNSSDMILRNSSYLLEDIYNPGFNFRYRLTDVLIAGLNVEYMRYTNEAGNLTVITSTGTETLKINDGFMLIPIELSLYYIIPFSTENFKFIMGGGAGYYYGSHVREFGDVSLETVSRKISYGIHVAIGMEYFIRHNISIRGEMRFRDPQFTVTSKYNKQESFYEGKSITLPQNEFDTKVNVDGVTFSIGAAFQF